MSFCVCKLTAYWPSEYLLACIFIMTYYCCETSTSILETFWVDAVQSTHTQSQDLQALYRTLQEEWKNSSVALPDKQRFTLHRSIHALTTIVSPCWLQGHLKLFSTSFPFLEFANFVTFLVYQYILLEIPKEQILPPVC